MNLKTFLAPFFFCNFILFSMGSISIFADAIDDDIHILNTQFKINVDRNNLGDILQFCRGDHDLEFEYRLGRNDLTADSKIYKGKFSPLSYLSFFAHYETIEHLIYRFEEIQKPVPKSRQIRRSNYFYEVIVKGIERREKWEFILKLVKSDVSPEHKISQHLLRKYIVSLISNDNLFILDSLHKNTSGVTPQEVHRNLNIDRYQPQISQFIVKNNIVQNALTDLIGTLWEMMNRDNNAEGVAKAREHLKTFVRFYGEPHHGDTICRGRYFRFNVKKTFEEIVRIEFPQHVDQLLEAYRLLEKEIILSEVLQNTYVHSQRETSSSRSMRQVTTKERESQPALTTMKQQQGIDQTPQRHALKNINNRKRVHFSSQVLVYETARPDTARLTDIHRPSKRMRIVKNDPPSPVVVELEDGEISNSIPNTSTTMTYANTNEESEEDPHLTNARDFYETSVRPSTQESAKGKELDNQEQQPFLDSRPCVTTGCRLAQLIWMSNVPNEIIVNALNRPLLDSGTCKVNGEQIPVLAWMIRNGRHDLFQQLIGSSDCHLDKICGETETIRTIVFQELLKKNMHATALNLLKNPSFSGSASQKGELIRMVFKLYFLGGIKENDFEEYVHDKDVFVESTPIYQDDQGKKLREDLIGHLVRANLNALLQLLKNDWFATANDASLIATKIYDDALKASDFKTVRSLLESALIKFDEEVLLE